MRKPVASLNCSSVRALQSQANGAGHFELKGSIRHICRVFHQEYILGPCTVPLVSLEINRTKASDLVTRGQGGVRIIFLRYVVIQVKRAVARYRSGVGRCLVCRDMSDSLRNVDLGIGPRHGISDAACGVWVRSVPSFRLEINDEKILGGILLRGD